MAGDRKEPQDYLLITGFMGCGVITEVLEQGGILWTVLNY